MGVEQLYLEAFNAAKTYDQEWKSFQASAAKKGANTTAPRRDLRLEALAEIVNKKRFISCHSYVQSEINMLMKVADKFGFKVNTFTHILEGYKVADKMAAHGVGGSTFADWWAYKMEVKDAIPYNAALMTKVGVTTAINSDDAEMARRLNLEAAKTIKYGGMSEAQALKMITLNPAKLLHLDKKMGTIAPGKDADLVLWTDKPLSNYARVTQTWVDGVSMFSLEEDESRKAYVAQEKARLVQAMLKTKQKGGSMQKPDGRKPRIYHCEDLEDHEL
jgi:imidazolonepropionase-like amidohydrolase